MADFTPLVAFGSLAYALTQFYKLVAAGDWKAVIVQLASWMAGVTVVLLATATQFADAIHVGNYTLAGLSLASQIFVGLTVAGTANLAYSVKQAVDNTDTDKTGQATPAPTPAPVTEAATIPQTETVPTTYEPSVTDEQPMGFREPKRPKPKVTKERATTRPSKKKAQAPVMVAEEPHMGPRKIPAR